MVKPARAARIRSNSTDLAAAPSLAALNDQQFEQVLLKNAHPPVRDAAAWEQLTAPDPIDRTKRVLTAMRARNRRAIHRKSRHLNEFHERLSVTLGLEAALVGLSALGVRRRTR